MSNIPQWQINLLARYPRPVAVTLIAAVDLAAGIRAWFWETALIPLLIVSWFIGLPVLVAHVFQMNFSNFAAVLLVNLIGTFAVIVLAGELVERYDRLNKRLPRREKKPDDDRPT